MLKLYVYIYVELISKQATHPRHLNTAARSRHPPAAGRSQPRVMPRRLASSKNIDADRQNTATLAICFDPFPMHEHPTVMIDRKKHE